jgi:hypothetical protein
MAICSMARRNSTVVVVLSRKRDIFAAINRMLDHMNKTERLRDGADLNVAFCCGEAKSFGLRARQGHLNKHRARAIPITITSMSMSNLP